jgi:hypothetical protein
MKMKYGPYQVGSTIPEDALVGVNQLTGQLYVVVGDFNQCIAEVPGNTDRQDVDGHGKVITEIYGGPPIRARVWAWQ